MHVDVIYNRRDVTFNPYPSGMGKLVPRNQLYGCVISTYFSVLYTNELIKKAELQGCSLETSPELLIGLNVIYRGEAESGKGNTYSKLEFCSEEEEDDYEEAACY